MGFLQPLIFLSSHANWDEFKHVHVISDSQYVVNTGNGVHKPKSHQALWRQLPSFTAAGLSLKFHWIPRDTIDLNRLADAVAGDARKAVSGILPEDYFERFSADTVDEVNPHQ